MKVKWIEMTWPANGIREYTDSETPRMGEVIGPVAAYSGLDVLQVHLLVLCDDNKLRTVPIEQVEVIER